MPQAILAVAPLLISGAAVITGGIITGALLVIGVTVGLTSLARSLLPKPPTAGPVSRDVTVRGTVEYRQIVYGEVKTGGFVAFYGTSGANNRFLWFVIVAAAHQCEDITDVWLDSRHVPDADIESDGEVTTEEFQDDGASRLYVIRFLGNAAQAASTALLANFPEWTSDHTGHGIAYTVFRLDRSENAFPTGAPQSFFQLTKGRRLYDPRLDSTNGGSGTHRTNNPATWAWSNNWALCVRDYISGGAIIYDSSTPDKRLTIGELDARINDTYTASEANISDEDVAIPPASPTTTQKRYTCNVQLSCGTTYRDNLAVLLSAGAGHLSYVDGKYRIYAGAYNTPTVTLDEHDIKGPVEVSTHPNGEDVYNLVTGTFFDPAREWTENPFPAQKNDTYATADGGQAPRSIRLLATTDNYRSQRLAMLELEDGRNKITANFTALSLKAMDIAEWETFQVTIPEYNWVAKVFRCLEWTFDPSGWPAIVARETSSSTYADPSAGDYTDPQTLVAPEKNIENPDAPSGFTATGQLNGILFKWAVPSIGRKTGLVQLFEYVPGSPIDNVFENADPTPIWEGYGFSHFLTRTTTDTSYFWIRIFRNGEYSTTEPAAAGLAGAASSVTVALTLTMTPPSVFKGINVEAGSPQAITSPIATAGAGGGTPPYTYAWTSVSGFAFTINSPTSSATTFSAGPFPVDGTVRAGIERCTVTDDDGATAYADVAVTLSWSGSVWG
jgi:hypothetical protein